MSDKPKHKSRYARSIARYVRFIEERQHQALHDDLRDLVDIDGQTFEVNGNAIMRIRPNRSHSEE